VRFVRASEQKEGAFLALLRPGFGYDLFQLSIVCLANDVGALSDAQTSRIKATLPSLMMLAPANVLMPLICLLKGFTTISSVSLIVSTIRPKGRPSACKTTILMGPAASVPSFGFTSSSWSQVGEGQEALSQAINRRAMHELNFRLGLLGLEAHQFQQAHLRNCVAVPGTGDDQRGDNRKRQRNLHTNGAALPGRRLHVDSAANLFDVGLDHVHADAAAGNVGNLLSGGESREENEVVGFAVRQARGLVWAQETAFDSLLLDAIAIQSTAIVADFNIDLAALVEGAQQEASCSSLPALTRTSGNSIP